MTIRYTNGYQIEGVLLSRDEHSMRIAIQGSDDVLRLSDINGTWITEDCEPVYVEFAWRQREDTAAVMLDDCVCSKELAAKLLHMLFSGESDAEAEAASVGRSAGAPAYHQIV